jgi:hypothetical protein
MSNIFPTEASNNSDKLVSTNLSRAETVRQGAAAMERLAKVETWPDWVLVICALEEGRKTATAEARGKSRGRRYSAAFNKWFRLHSEFERVDKADRSRFHECFVNLDAITSWRDQQPPERQIKLNYPVTVLAHWKRSFRTIEGPGEKNPDPPSDVIVAWLVNAWNASSDDDRTAALRTIGLDAVLKVLPPEWLSSIEKKLGRQIIQREKTKHPNTKLKYLRLAYNADIPTAL